MTGQTSDIGFSYRPAGRGGYTPPVILSVFVVAYCAYLLWIPGVGFADYEVLRESVLASEHSFPSGVFPAMGRFYPMFVKEFALIQLFSTDIAYLFFFVALQCAVFAALVWILLIRAWPNRWMVTGVIVSLYLLPAFTNAWGSLGACERNVSFYLACFLLAYSANATRPREYWAVISLLSANAAIYGKEPVFGAVAIFVVARLWIQHRNGISNVCKRLDSLLLASSVFFVIAYIVFAYLPRGPHVYGTHAASGDGTLARNLINYALNDPTILFVAFPLALGRLAVILRDRRRADPLYDPMLLAGVAYAFAFVVLNLYAPNYWMPAYVFVLPPILRFIGRDNAWTGRGWRPILATAGLLTALNAIPLGVHILSMPKYAAVNEIAAMDALARDLSRQIDQGRHPAIFIDGVAPELTAHDPGQTYDRDAYFNVAEALKRRGIPGYAFDLKSSLRPKDTGIRPRPGDPAARYTAFTGDGPSVIEAGDYLLIVANSATHISPDYIESLAYDYAAIHRTPPGQGGIPNFSLRTLLKWLLIQSRWSWMVTDRNLLRLPNYYVFRRK